jgi:alpha-tubulin suppressor-like RCC1 family protein
MRKSGAHFLSYALFVLVLPLLAGNVPAQTVTRIACGSDHSLFAKSDGTVWGMGDNSSGQLGIGFSPSHTNSPQLILSGVFGPIAAGKYHNLLISGRGLWVMGFNGEGQLGDGSADVNHYFPEKVVTLSGTTGFSALGAGAFHSFYATSAVLSGGSALSASGEDLSGQLGDGHYSNTNKFEQVVQANIIAIAGGSRHSLFVESDGSLWAMGDNTYGQLGDGTTNSINRPERILSGGVTAVACGFTSSLFLKSDGSLWAMGQNDFGQLGDNSTTERHSPEQIQFNNVTAIVSGESYNLFIKSDGSLWGMGRNDSGQLGDGSTTDRHVPVRIVASNVVAAAGGISHSLFIKSDGSLWGMGHNKFGELGHSANTTTPVELVPPPQPVINSISVVGANAVVAWPTNTVGFNLQSTTNLASPVIWTTVSTPPSIVNNQFMVTNAMIGRAQFYRLSE